MCLGVPGRVLQIEGDDVVRMGVVDFGGLRKDVSLAYLPEVVVGDYVIVHVGFAITQVDEEEALRSYEVLRSIDGGSLLASELEP
jgi:hydrogenase expression/formation protein HypC